MTDPLALRAAEGDPGAWREITARYAPLVGAVAARHGLYWDDREDVAQDVWAALHRHAAGVENLSGWLQATAAHRCLDRIRAGRRRRELPVGDDLFVIEAAAPVAFADDPDAAGSSPVMRLAAGLPRQQRRVLALDADGWTDREIAAVLGISAGAVKSHLHRARARMRHLLQQREAAGQQPAAPASGDGTAVLEWYRERRRDALLAAAPAPEPEPEEDPEPDFLTPAQAMELAGISRATVEREIAAGHLPVAFRDRAGHPRFDPFDAEEWAIARWATPGTDQMLDVLDSGPDVLTTARVAKVAGLGHATVAREADAGRLPVARTPGGHRRYRREDVAEWIRSGLPSPKRHREAA